MQGWSWQLPEDLSGHTGSGEPGMHRLSEMRRYRGNRMCKGPGVGRSWQV